LKAALSKLFPLALLLSVVSACNMAQKVKQGVEQASQPKAVRSADGRFELTVPGTWREDPELHEEAEIEVSNRLNEMYIVVLTESKEDFADEVDLAAFASMSRQQLTSNIQQPEATEPAPAAVGSYPAMQYTMNGVVDNLKAAYIITLVETPDNFHQIVAWTLRSKFDANEKTLREVTASFKQVPGVPAAPARAGDNSELPPDPGESPAAPGDDGAEPSPEPATPNTRRP